jgi:hypothetical protein
MSLTDLQRAALQMLGRRQNRAMAGLKWGGRAWSPMNTWTERHEQAQRQVKDGQRVIDCQRVLIAMRKALGEGTDQLQEMLATFEDSQAISEGNLARIRTSR